MDKSQMDDDSLFLSKEEVVKAISEHLRLDFPFGGMAFLNIDSVERVAKIIVEIVKDNMQQFQDDKGN